MKRGFTFMKQAFAMVKEQPRLLKPSLFSVVFGIGYFIVWAVIFVALLAGGMDPESGTSYTLGAIATFGSFVIFYFFCGMTVHMVDVHLEGGTPTMGEAFRDAKKNFGAICALSVISTIVELLAKAGRGRGRGGFAIVGRIITSIIHTLWTVLSFLLLPAIIIEDLSLPKALRRVRELHSKNMMLIGVGEVGVRLVTALFGFVMVLGLFAIGYMGLGILGGTFGVALTIIVAGTVLTIFSAFSSYLRMSYYTCLYLWAVETERKGAEAPAPLPLAVALNRPARPREPRAAA